MNVLPYSLVLLMAFVVGCEYRAPLAEKGTQKIDPRVLGLWREAPAEPSKTPDEIIIMRATDSEYFVSYAMNQQTLFFRAYPIRLGGIQMVQTELIGDGQGAPGQEVTERYHVLRYRVDAQTLELSTLNTDLLDTSLGTTAELQDAFFKVTGDPELFEEPGIFKRVSRPKEN